MKKLLAFLFVSTMTLHVSGQVNEPMPPAWWNENECYLWYGGTDQTGEHVTEYVYTWQETETVNGKSYYVVYNKFYPESGVKKIVPIHMRKDGKQLLVVYNEYKQLMEAKGYDVTDFDNTCRYEITSDGEMVLYNFGMQVGDKFRSVPGREDIYVEKIGKPAYDPLTNQHELLDCFYLSNGSTIVADIGYAGSTVSGHNGSFFDYLNVDEGNLELLYALECGSNLYNSIFDHNTTSVTPRTAMPSESARIFNLNGQELKAIPEKGIYIQNGKKVVIK